MRMESWLRAIVFLLVLAGCIRGEAWSQGYGTISGTVTDASGGSVVGAKVIVVDPANAQTRTATTNESGYYVVTSLNPATYTVKVEQRGFREITQSNVVLQASQSLTLNIALTIGTVDEQVTVEAEPIQVDTTTPTLKEVVDKTRMIAIPLNGRNAAMLTTLVSGAVISPSNNADQGNAKTFPAAVPISVNGTRENQTGYWLDGAPNIDFISNINQPFPFPDALQEFSVQTSDYSAEYGQDAGGVVSIVTKSGANQFHGSAFEFLRNRVFNARNYFATARDPLKRNQFGGTFGGPIRHDRTFFFGGYQGTRIRSSQNGQSAFVPTDANRAGDFSAYLSASDPNNPLGKAVILPAPFVNNKINPSQFDPASMTMLNFVPHAQGNGFVSYTTPIIQNFDEFIVRGDHAITSTDKLVGRYYYDRFYNVADYGGNLLAYRQGSTISSHNAVIELQHQFSSNMLNDFDIGFMRIVSIRQPPASTPDVADFGVPIYQPTPKAIQSLSISGYFSTGANPTAKFPRTGYSYADNLRWVHGNHSFAFGATYERDSLNMRNVLGLPGTFSFSGDTTGSALADFMLGDLRTFGQANGQHVKNRYWMLNGYAEDSWHVSKRLTLSYGIRYEPTRVWHDLYHQNSVFYPDAFAAGTHSAVFPNAPPGLMFTGDSRVPEDGITGDYRNIAPRTGFAWDVFGNGHTSLRGGFGIFYDSRVPAFSNNRFLGAAPFSATVSLTTPKGPFSNPYLGVPNPFPAVFPPSSSATFVQPVQVFTWDPKNKYFTPRNYMVNLAVEQDLGKGLLMRIAYVGSRGQYMTVTVDQNPAQYIPGCSLTTDQRRRYNNPSAACGAPYTPQYSNIYQQSNSGNSWYHSGQFSLTKPLRHGFTVLANYTWSKSTDSLPWGTDAATFGTAGYYTLPLTAPNFRRYDEGLSDYNHEHVFVTSYVWQTPALNKMNSIARETFGNWEFSGIVTAESGAPLALYTGTDRSQTGIGKDRPVLLPGANPYEKGSCATTTTRSCLHWLNPAAFALPAVGSFGNVGKGQFIGPGYWNWDMGLMKNFPIKERYTTQFRAEMFNTFNHPNFMNDATGSYAKGPVQTYTGAGFGNILAANDPRIIQFALKVIF
jgi:hypothetical protein